MGKHYKWQFSIAMLVYRRVNPIGSMVLLYMVTWIPSTKKPFMLALIYQHHGSVMGIAEPHNYPKWLFNIAMERSTIFNS